MRLTIALLTLILFSCKSEEQKRKDELDKLLELSKVHLQSCKDIQDDLIWKVKRNMPAEGLKEKLDSCNRITDSLNERVLLLIGTTAK